jgi:hypothetical protein
MAPTGDEAPSLTPRHFRRRGVVIAGVIGLVLLAAAGARTLQGEPVGGHLAGFRQTVQTDQREYRPDDGVVIHTRVCRSRPWPVFTSSGGGTDLLTSFAIIDSGGDVVADDTHAVRTMELRRVPWLPGMCRTARHEWDQRYWNQGELPEGDRVALGAPIRGERVPPDDYRAQVQWHSMRWGGPPRPAEPITSPRFTISP